MFRKGDTSNNVLFSFFLIVAAGLIVRWHDSRVPIAQAEGIRECLGFLVNEALVDGVGRESSSSHWYTIRKVSIKVDVHVTKICWINWLSSVQIENYFYDLDSAFEKPKVRPHIVC